jgi:hypothetical protein
MLLSSPIYHETSSCQCFDYVPIQSRKLPYIPSGIRTPLTSTAVITTLGRSSSTSRRGFLPFPYTAAFFFFAKLILEVTTGNVLSPSSWPSSLVGSRILLILVTAGCAISNKLFPLRSSLAPLFVVNRCVDQVLLCFLPCLSRFSYFLYMYMHVLCFVLDDKLSATQHVVLTNSCHFCVPLFLVAMSSLLCCNDMCCGLQP